MQVVVGVRASVCVCTRVRVVGVRRCMRIWKSQWQPYQNEGPRGAHGKRGERPTNRGPNIGCQEFSYLDATLGKSRAFSRKFFSRPWRDRRAMHGGTLNRSVRSLRETRCNEREARRNPSNYHESSTNAETNGTISLRELIHARTVVKVLTGHGTREIKLKLRANIGFGLVVFKIIDSDRVLNRACLIIYYRMYLKQSFQFEHLLQALLFFDTSNSGNHPG